MPAHTHSLRSAMPKSSQSVSQSAIRPASQASDAAVQIAAHSSTSILFHGRGSTTRGQKISTGAAAVAWSELARISLLTRDYRLDDLRWHDRLCFWRIRRLCSNRGCQSSIETRWTTIRNGRDQRSRRRRHWRSRCLHVVHSEREQSHLVGRSCEEGANHCPRFVPG